ncbi:MULTISPECIES: hypothetical protein [Cryobacterium]|nr:MULTISPECIES: hypothetical protein [Cryobacterium]
MARLLKFLPVIVTLVTKYLRSPQGKAALHKMRSARQKTKNARTTRRRF